MDLRFTPEENAFRKEVRTFFERGFLRWVEVDLPTARHARILSREHGLRGADAIHLASAIRGRTERFVTWDVRGQCGMPWWRPGWIPARG